MPDKERRFQTLLRIVGFAAIGFSALLFLSGAVPAGVNVFIRKVEWIPDLMLVRTALGLAALAISTAVTAGLAKK